MSDSWLLGSAELKSAVSQCSHTKYMNVFMVACLKPPVQGTIVEEIYSPYVPNHWVTNLHKKALDNMTLTALYFPLLLDLPAAMDSNLPLHKKNLPKSIMKNIFLSLYLAPCAYRPVPCRPWFNDSMIDTHAKLVGTSPAPPDMPTYSALYKECWWALGSQGIKLFHVHHH